MPAPKNPNTAAATAAVRRRGQETMAAKLRADGWTCTPPEDVHHSPDDVVKRDVEGRVHLLVPERAAMACGVKIGEHWSSALNVEAVNCPDCLARMSESAPPRMAMEGPACGTCQGRGCPECEER